MSSWIFEVVSPCSDLCRLRRHPEPAAFLAPFHAQGHMAGVQVSGSLTLKSAPASSLVFCFLSTWISVMHLHLNSPLWGVWVAQSIEGLTLSLKKKILNFFLNTPTFAIPTGTSSGVLSPMPVSSQLGLYSCLSFWILDNHLYCSHSPGWDLGILSQDSPFCKCWACLMPPLSLGLTSWIEIWSFCTSPEVSQVPTFQSQVSVCHPAL